MVSKRILVVLFFVVAVCAAGFSQEQKKIKILVAKPEIKGITGYDGLSKRIQTLLEVNMQKYADFLTLADEEVEEQLKKQQRRQEYTSHSDKEIIDVGNFLNAQYILFPSVSRIGNDYMLDIRFTNLTDSAMNTATSEPYSEIKELYGAHPNAVDDVTLEICEQLGISLSKEQLKILKHGEENKVARQRKKQGTENKNTNVDAFDLKRLGFAFSADFSSTVHFTFKMKYDNRGWFNSNADSGISAYFGGGANVWRKNSSWDDMFGFVLFGSQLKTKRLLPYIEIGVGFGSVNMSEKAKFGEYLYSEIGLEFRLLSHISTNIFIKPQMITYTANGARKKLGAFSFGMSIDCWALFNK